MTTRARASTPPRGAGTPAPWGDLGDEHVGQAITLETPWAPGDSVTVTFLERGYDPGPRVRELSPAEYDDDGNETTPAELEVTPRFVHVVDHPEWGRNSFELDAAWPVEVGA